MYLSILGDRFSNQILKIGTDIAQNTYLDF